MPSADSDGYDPAQRQALLELARSSIAHGLDKGYPLPVDQDAYAPKLRERRATFVTLHEQGDLRGCIGHLKAIQPLVLDVAENAFNAAFRDPRFPPLAPSELDELVIEISVLTPPLPLSFGSQDELLGIIQPGRDGLVLEEGGASGTFLPTVWDDLPDPRDFLRHLKRKAGLDPDYWSDAIRIKRYRTESFSDSDLKAGFG